jgi:hypothetical protein
MRPAALLKVDGEVIIFVVIVTGLIHRFHCAATRLEVVMRLVSREHMMRILIPSELIAQEVLNWRLAAVATLAMLSKRSSFQ